MYYFKDIIEEIEKNITNDIDIEKLAKMTNMSVYEFRRVFTFVAKMPLGEYIRKRRLSVAAAEIYKSEKNISYFSQKYGYESTSSFSRAFREFHGVSPTEVLDGNSSFKLLTRINAEIIVSGCNNIEYSIINDEEFYVSGVKTQSSLTDTECCEDAWDNFYKSTISGEIVKGEKNIYAVYKNAGNCVECYIGARNSDYTDLIRIPKTQWAVYKLNSTKDEVVNEFYNNALNAYISSAGFVRDFDIPNIEVYPADMSGDDFEWEIHIPIK